MPVIRSRRTKRLVAVAAVLLLALSIAACGGGEEPTPTPTPLPTATPTPTPAPTPTPEAAEAGTADDVVAASEGDIVVSEQQINEMLGETLSGQQDLPISDVNVDLQPDLIVGTGKLALGFINSSFKLSLRLSAVDGKVIPEVVEILLNDQPAPALLQGQIDALTTPYIEQASAADYGFYVDSIVVTDDEIVISGE